jgi:hypothetical protein
MGTVAVFRVLPEETLAFLTYEVLLSIEGERFENPFCFGPGRKFLLK